MNCARYVVSTLFIGFILLFNTGCESNDSSPDPTPVPEKSVPKDNTPDTPDKPDTPKILPGEVGIHIGSVPSMGQEGNVSGTVSGINPSEYKVVMYINVSGAWWIKPYNGDSISIGGSGKWSGDMTTGGIDIYASSVTVYLLPKADGFPSLLGSSSLPAGFNRYPHDSKPR
jgi:hypothetical protein